MTWTRVLQAADEVEALAGRLPTQGERGQMIAGVRRLNDRGLYFWWDEDNARGWLAHLQTLVSAESERAIDAMPYARQCEKVVEAMQALGHLYNALDLPYTSDPVLRTVVERNHRGSESTAWCEDGAWSQWAATHNAYVGPADAYRIDGYEGSAPVVGCIQIHHRLAWRRVNNTVDTTYLHYGGWPSADYWTRHYDTIPGSGGAWSWRTYAWHSECEERGGILGAGDCRRWKNSFFPPAFWYYQQVREIVTGLAVNGLFATAMFARRFALLTNIRTAVLLGVYRPSTSDPDGTTELVDRAEIGREEARRTVPSQTTEMFDAFDTGIEMGSQIPGAQAYGGFLALGVAGMRALTAAVAAEGAFAAQRVVDRFGREGFLKTVRQFDGSTRPEVVAWEGGSLTGGARAEEEPTHPLATPPTPRTVTLSTFVLPNGGGGGGHGGRPALGEFTRTEQENVHDDGGRPPLGETVMRLGPELVQGFRDQVSAIKVARRQYEQEQQLANKPPSSSGTRWVVAGVFGVLAVGAVVVVAGRSK